MGNALEIAQTGAPRQVVHASAVSWLEVAMREFAECSGQVKTGSAELTKILNTELGHAAIK